MHDCRQYFAATGRRVTFEYTLMAGVNASPQDVSHCHVAADGSGWSCSEFITEVLLHWRASAGQSCAEVSSSYAAVCRPANEPHTS